MENKKKESFFRNNALAIFGVVMVSLTCMGATFPLASMPVLFDASNQKYLTRIHIPFRWVSTRSFEERKRVERNIEMALRIQRAIATST